MATTEQVLIKNKALSSASAPVTVGQIPTNAAYATHSVQLTHTNRNASQDANIQIYLSTATSPTAADMIANKVVPPGGELTIACELAGPGEYLIVTSNSAEVAIRHTGVASVVTP